jgi:hypothetical protein
MDRISITDSRFIIINGFSANTDVLQKTLQEVKNWPFGRLRAGNSWRGFSEA